MVKGDGFDRLLREKVTSITISQLALPWQLFAYVI
jgi:hypothetical protein